MNLSELLGKVREYNPAADVATLQRAYEFSAEVHRGQKRKSGEPYLVHPLEVAGLIADLRLDVPSVVTGLLHDTVEDTLTTLAQVESLFGNEIATLVDGVTKIGQINFKSRAESQAENFRKMIIAMARDIRVILIKLADRTHNMRTLSHLPPERQTEIAQETLDIYAPLAHRLGIYWIKSELEDNALRYMHPEVYYQLKRNVAKKTHRARAVHRARAGRAHEEAGSGRARGHDHRAAEALLLDLPEDADAAPALRSDLRPGGVPPASSTRRASATRRSASCTRTGSRCRGASATTSPCRRRTCTSRCTPR